MSSIHLPPAIQARLESFVATGKLGAGALSTPDGGALADGVVDRVTTAISHVTLFDETDLDRAPGSPNRVELDAAGLRELGELYPQTRAVLADAQEVRCETLHENGYLLTARRGDGEVSYLAALPIGGCVGYFLADAQQTVAVMPRFQGPSRMQVAGDWLLSG